MLVALRSSSATCVAHVAPAQEAERAAGRLVVQQDVLGDRHAVDQVDVLVNGDDAVPQRVIGAAEASIGCAVRASSCRHPAGRRRPGSSAACSCRRRSRRPGRARGPASTAKSTPLQRLHAGEGLDDVARIAGSGVRSVGSSPAALAWSAENRMPRGLSALDAVPRDAVAGATCRRHLRVVRRTRRRSPWSAHGSAGPCGPAACRRSAWSPWRSCPRSPS